MVHLTVKVINQQGQPVSHAYVRLSRSQNYLSNSYGWTDSAGVTSGLIPANEVLQLAILDNCGNVLYTQTIGPFSQNTILPPVTIPSSVTVITTVSGKLVDCNNIAVSNGMAIVSIGNFSRYVSVDSNGNFSASITSCTGASAPVKVSGVNFTATQQSTYTFNYSSPVLNVGNVVVCANNTSGEFMIYTVNGVTTSVTSVATSGYYNWVNQTNSGTLLPPNTSTLYHNISVRNASLNQQFGFVINTQVGQAPATTYPLVSISYNNVSTGGGATGGTVTFTHFATAPGDYFEGSMTGTYQRIQGQLYPVSATFKLKRVQ
jgi:hypothetical protein